MKRFLVAACLALSLGACAQLQNAVGIATTSVSNPISLNQLAAVESSYAAILSVAVKYRRLPLCRTGETEFSGPTLCARRSVVVQIQSANRTAHAAILTARNFVRRNPTVDASAVIAAAVDAVSRFRAVVPTTGGA